MNRPTIEIHTMVLGYQRRYWWQLSSILDQVTDGHPLPHLRMVFSTTERDPHFAWNERLLEVFGDRLDLHMDVWPESDETYGRRGHIRSKNLRECAADYLLFNDGDMVYDPRFFSRLAALLAVQPPDEHRVYASARKSMSFERGYQLVADHEYDRPVDGAARRVLAGKTWDAAGGRVSGAGFFQLVNVRALRAYMARQGHSAEHYVEPGWNKDHNTFETTHITRSDRHFRLRCGGIVPLDLPPQWHLNHYRKNDAGYPHGEVH